MKKIIISILLTSVLLISGCTKYIEVPYYIEGTCPAIATVKVVPPIPVITDTNGTVMCESLPTLLQGATMLRKSERYYIKQIDIYNSKFTDKPVDK